MSSSGLSTIRKPRHHQPEVKPLRVLISAASSITRAGLERLLEKQPSVQLVGAISSADDLPPAIAENDPDVVLLRLDAQSSETNWEELVALEVPIVLLAAEADLVTATAVLAGGVHAILLGDATGAELAAAAHSAAAGLLTLCTPIFASFSPVILPTPGKRPTGNGNRNASISSGWMTNSPSGLRRSEASFAKNLFGATPAEAVRCNS